MMSNNPEEASSSPKLHHVHAAPQATRVQFDDPHPMTWRADGTAPLTIKSQVARRLAVCWNVLEGLPTEALENGILREVFEAISANDLARAKRAAARVEQSYDLTENGKVHACKSCP
jgi:hypothetical protein